MGAAVSALASAPPSWPFIDIWSPPAAGAPADGRGPELSMPPAGTPSSSTARHGVMEDLQRSAKASPPFFALAQADKAPSPGLSVRSWRCGVPPVADSRPGTPDRKGWIYFVARARPTILECSWLALSRLQSLSQAILPGCGSLCSTTSGHDASRPGLAAGCLALALAWRRAGSRVTSRLEPTVLFRIFH